MALTSHTWDHPNTQGLYLGSALGTNFLPELCWRRAGLQLSHGLVIWGSTSGLTFMLDLRLNLITVILPYDLRVFDGRGHCL